VNGHSGARPLPCFAALHSRRAAALAFVAFEYLDRKEAGMGNAAGPMATPFLCVVPVGCASGKLGAGWVFASVGACQTDYSLLTIPRPLPFLAER